MNKKFESLECLIQEYYGLVENNEDGLPPYATFKTYLVDEDSCCINRPQKIKELVGKLSDDSEEEKLNAILELWASDKKSTVLHNDFDQNHPQLIHSITPRANTIATKLNLKNLKTYDDQKIKILEFIEEVSRLVKEWNKDRFDEGQFIKLGSAEKELLFWYYYADDKYPIINQRAKMSKDILLNSLVDMSYANDMEFNKVCMDVSEFNAIKKEDKIYISKQLMLDQLFYSIDEMKSMKKVQEEYESNTDHEIYKFYTKLWNTIKEAKTNSKLQGHYEQFCNDYEKTENQWFKKFKFWSTILQELKGKEYENYEILNEEFKKKCEDTNEDFLQRYLFEKSSNGITGGGQYHTGWDEIVKSFTQDKDKIVEILKSTDIDEVNELIEKMTKQHKLKKNRLLIPLFPEKMTTISSEKSFDELISNLKSKLNMSVEGECYLDKNESLMNIYLKNKDGNEETDIHKKQLFYWWLYKYLNDNLDLKKAIVYYGAPGTGKTFKAKKVAKQFVETWNIKNSSFVNTKSPTNSIAIQQFHPSFSYEDFIEGIRPSGQGQLKLQNGVFKKFCKQFGTIEIDLWKNEVFRKKYQNDGDFLKITVSELKVLNNETINKILSIDKDKDYKNLKLLDMIQPAFFIIDEINRADLSRVFGELMYSLEYRGYEGKIKTQYSYLVKDENDDATYFFEEKEKENYFFIPQNIYIIGTMNTIDRSVDSFDFALRRRFSWEEIPPDYEVIRNLLNPKIADDVATSLNKLNTEICKNALLGNDYQVGHSYALNLMSTDIINPKQATKFLWDTFIYPLLQEYFRGLGDSKVELEKLEKAFV